MRGKSVDTCIYEEFGLPAWWAPKPELGKAIFDLAAERFQEGSESGMIAQNAEGHRVRAIAMGAEHPELPLTQLDISSVTGKQKTFEIKAFGKFATSSYASLLELNSKTVLVEKVRRRYNLKVTQACADIGFIEDAGNILLTPSQRWKGGIIREDYGVAVHHDKPEILEIVNPKKAARMRRGLALISQPLAEILRLELKFSKIVHPETEAFEDLSVGLPLLKAA
ncbi:MAG: hypothetical protein WA843_01300 [Candidatus Saccharimonadales bacterium]